MPFDTTGVAILAIPPRCQRQAALWLFIVSAMILVMIVLGGLTRLNGAGLSIMEWAPIGGALPPLHRAEWQRLFDLYRQIPQFKLLHADFTLGDFQQIFWLEWLHRLWGRILGVVFLGPLLWFGWRGALAGMLPRLVAIFVLGGLQGAVGWFMVASGFFPDSTAVSPYRLVMHLGLALALYATVLWTALDLSQSFPLPAGGARMLRRLTHAACGVLGLTILAGGFVAGTHAGLIDNSFPLMEGHLIPPDYAAMAFPRGWFENLATVQFDHRVLATLSLVLAAITALRGTRRDLPAFVRRRALASGGAVVLQYGLGVSTLLHMVPTWLAAAHQAMAIVAFSAALVLLHGLRGARSSATIPIAA